MGGFFLSYSVLTEDKYMPYCNQCGRYIGGGMLCQWCGDARENPINPKATQMHSPPHPCPVPDEEEPKNMPSPPESDMESPACSPDTAASEEACDEEALFANLPSFADFAIPTPTTDEATPPPNPVSSEESPSPEAASTPASDPSKHTFTTASKCAAKNAYSAFFGVPDLTERFSVRDIREHRGMAILSYLWVLWFIPYLFARRTRYVRYHLEAALPCLLVDCLALSLGGIAILIGSFAPIVAPLFAASAELLLLTGVWMKVRGILSACGKRRTRTA